MKLHEQVKAQQEIIERYEEAMADLRRYLCLPKFADDVMVNKADIFLRIAEAELDISRLKIEMM